MMDEMHKQGIIDEGSMKKGKEMMDMKGRKKIRKNLINWPHFDDGTISFSYWACGLSEK